MSRCKRTTWEKRVGAWRSSGQTAREFSELRGINRLTLLWWSSRLGRRAQSSKTGALAVAPAFVEVLPPRPAAESGAVEVLLRHGQRVRVTAGFDPALLRSVVAALEER